MVAWQKEHVANRNPVPLVPKGSLSKDVHVGLMGNQLIHVHLKKWPPNGNSYLASFRQ